MPGPVVFDLTEVLLASTGKLRWYGIVRTVAEIGAHLARLDQAARFCVFSAGHGRFFEVTPRRGADGEVTFDVPEGVRQLRIRSVFPERRLLRDAAAAGGRALANALNRRAWARAGVDLPEIALEGCTYVTCSRPKLIVEEMVAITRRGWTVELVPMLYDLIPLHDHFEHPGQSFSTNFIADNIHILDRADRVLTISHFTKDELLRFVSMGHLPAIPPSRIHPIPLVHECPEGTEPPGPPPPAEPYLLAVGSMLGRKNLEAAFDALALLKARGGPVPRLVVAGARRLRTEKHLATEARADIRDLVTFRHAPSQTDLVALYRGAVATLVPSRMEGWGLPAGESLWLGTPAICATAPALREVAGELGLYFDPDSADALADHVARLMTDNAFAGDLRARIAAARPILRGWADVARDVIRALEAPGA